MTHSSMTPLDKPDIFRDVLNLAGNAVMVFGWPNSATGTIHDLRLSIANQPARTLIGFHDELASDQPATALLPLLNEVEQELLHVTTTGEPFETERFYRTSAQEPGNWYRLLLQKYGHELALSLTDITALKREASLAQKALNGSINGMIAYDSMRDEAGHIYDFKVQLANEAAARISGLSLEQILRGTMVSIRPSIIASGLFDRYKHTAETGEAQRFEFYYNYDGLDGWYDISASKLNDGLLITYMDITSTKRSEQELKASIEQLKQSNQSLEQFAYVASHDLQEPLRKIQSFGDMLRSQHQGDLNHTSIDLINRMQSAAQRMSLLIHDLLAFSKLSSKKQPFQATNLQDVLAEVVADLEPTIRHQQAKLSITSLPIIVGNSGQLHQLFQNLLSNALKFISTNANPTIRIDCHQVTGQQITPLPGQLVAQRDWDLPFYAISVVDNGIGIDPKYLDRIFTVFQRLHTRNEYQGTGVGLSIVQKVVENHHGYISVQSQPGSGSTFTIYFHADLIKH